MERTNRRGEREKRRAKILQLTLLGILAILALCASGFVILTKPTPPPAEGRAASYTPPAPQLPKALPSAAFIGDSWVGGSDMGGNGWDNFSYILAGRMNWGFIDLSQGGSGYLRDVKPRGTFSDPARLDVIKEKQPAYTFVVNGVNDWQERDANTENLAAAADVTYTAIKKAAPKTKLIVIGMMAPGEPNVNLVQARDVLRPIVEKHGGLFIDPVTDPWWKGDAQKYVGSDKYHVNDAGHLFLATKLEGILKRELKLNPPAWKATGSAKQP